MAIDTTLALVSLADAKAFLKITGSTEDSFVGDVVNHASAWINKFCDRVFLATTGIVEYHDGEDELQSILLNNFPVTAIDSIYEDPLHVFGASTLIASSNYYIKGATGEVVLYNQRSRFVCGKDSIKVTYSAGYALAAMPQDIQLACKLLVGYVYRTMYSQWRLGVASETVGQKTVTFDKAAMPKEVEGILKPHRNLKAGY